MNKSPLCKTTNTEDAAAYTTGEACR